MWSHFSTRLPDAHADISVCLSRSDSFLQTDSFCKTSSSKTRKPPQSLPRRRSDPNDKTRPSEKSHTASLAVTNLFLTASKTSLLADFCRFHVWFSQFWFCAVSRQNTATFLFFPAERASMQACSAAARQTNWLTVLTYKVPVVLHNEKNPAGFFMRTLWV